MCLWVRVCVCVCVCVWVGVGVHASVRFLRLWQRGVCLLVLVFVSVRITYLCFARTRENEWVFLPYYSQVSIIRPFLLLIIRPFLLLISRTFPLLIFGAFPPVIRAFLLVLTTIIRKLIIRAFSYYLRASWLGRFNVGQLHSRLAGSIAYLHNLIITLY